MIPRPSNPLGRPAWVPWTQPMLTESDNSALSTTAGRADTLYKLSDGGPIHTASSAQALASSYYCQTGATLPAAIVWRLGRRVLIRRITMRQLANADGGIRDWQLFADAALTLPASSIITSPNNVTNPGSVAPGDTLGSAATFGAAAASEAIYHETDTIYIKVWSRWGKYYFGMQEVEIEGYIKP